MKNETEKCLWQHTKWFLKVINNQIIQEIQSLFSKSLCQYERSAIKMQILISDNDNILSVFFLCNPIRFFQCTSNLLTNMKKI